MNAHRMEALTIVAFVVACGLAIGGATAQSSASPHAAGPGQTVTSSGAKKAEEQFKNIQVLKGVPAEEIFPTMQFITASLGVECDFCHVQGAFEKDDKKNKQTARKMMEMMFAINADNFDRHREVTCNTCHRGSPKPLAIPALMTAESTPAMGAPEKAEGEAKESTGPAAAQLIDKYVQASGGAAAIDKVTSRVMKGTIER